ncbi:MAG TPA: hypothetical protein VD999_07270 [Vitreimonas sp.]|nr:hypothetical protein [Vitreimonas sp.]
MSKEPLKQYRTWEETPKAQWVKKQAHRLNLLSQSSEPLGWDDQADFDFINWYKSEGFNLSEDKIQAKRDEFRRRDCPYKNWEETSQAMMVKAIENNVNVTLINNPGKELHWQLAARQVWIEWYKSVGYIYSKPFGNNDDVYEEVEIIERRFKPEEEESE